MEIAVRAHHVAISCPLLIARWSCFMYRIFAALHGALSHAVRDETTVVMKLLWRGETSQPRKQSVQADSVGKEKMDLIGMETTSCPDCWGKRLLCSVHIHYWASGL